MSRKSHQNSKTFKDTAQYSTKDFLETLAVIVDDPGNRSFQWGDGGSVVVNTELYEEEVSRCDELSTLKELRDVTALRTLMLAYGFKKMARMSKGNIHVFQHPNFSIKSAHLKKDIKRESKSAVTSSSRTQKQKPRKKTNEQSLMDRQPSPSSSHPFLPEKRRSARSLYQYINNELTLPDSHRSEETPSISVPASPSFSHLEQLHSVCFTYDHSRAH